MGLVNTLILARLLVPDDFGLIAIAVIITQLLQNVSDIGVSYTVVHYKEAEDKDYDALFTLSLIRGVIIFVILTISAPLAARIYDDPRLLTIFVAMGAIALVQALINPKFYEFQRKLDFSKEFLVNISDKIFSVIVSVSIAILYQNYWAIIFGIAAGALAKLLISYALRPYLPKIGLKAVDGLFKFTGWLTGLSILAAFNNKLDVLILGKVLPADETGNYFIGYQLADLPSSELAAPIARALFPGLSALKEEPTKMRETLLRVAECVASIVMPACIGLAFIADDFVQLVLGDNWAYVPGLIQWVTPFAAITCVYSGVHSYAIAKGAAKLLFFRELFFFFFRTPIFVGASLIYGLKGAIIAGGSMLLVNATLFALVFGYLSKENPLRPLWRARRSIASLTGIVLYFMVVRPLFPVLETFPIMVRIALDILISASVYTTFHISLWHLAGKPEGVEQMVFSSVPFLKKFSNPV